MTPPENKESAQSVLQNHVKIRRSEEVKKTLLQSRPGCGNWDESKAVKPQGATKNMQTLSPALSEFEVRIKVSEL